MAPLCCLGVRKCRVLDFKLLVNVKSRTKDGFRRVRQLLVRGEYLYFPWFLGTGRLMQESRRAEAKFPGDVLFPLM